VSFAQPPAGAPGQKAKPDAKDESKPEVKVAKADPLTFELRTLDDTVMKVVLQDPSISIVTKYGKLTVPASEVRRLEFGFRYPEGMEEKVTRGIADLGSPEFRTREDAEQTLADIGHFAIPALRRAAKGEDPEVVRRARAVLKLLEGKLGEGKTELR